MEMKECFSSLIIDIFKVYDQNPQGAGVIWSQTLPNMVHCLMPKEKLIDILEVHY